MPHLNVTGYSPKTRLRITRKSNADGSYTLSLVNITAVNVTAGIFSVDVVQPGNFTFSATMKPEANGLKASSVSDIQLDLAPGMRTSSRRWSSTALQLGQQIPLRTDQRSKIMPGFPFSPALAAVVIVGVERGAEEPRSAFAPSEGSSISREVEVVRGSAPARPVEHGRSRFVVEHSPRTLRATIDDDRTSGSEEIISRQREAVHVAPLLAVPYEPTSTSVNGRCASEDPERMGLGLFPTLPVACFHPNGSFTLVVPRAPCDEASSHRLRSTCLVDLAACGGEVAVLRAVPLELATRHDEPSAVGGGVTGVGAWPGRIIRRGHRAVGPSFERGPASAVPRAYSSAVGSAHAPARATATATTTATRRFTGSGYWNAAVKANAP